MTSPVRLDELIGSIKALHPDGDPLGELADAVYFGEHLGELADHLIGHFVDQARRSGASWTEIGRSMGVSKQAVQKRFVAGSSESVVERVFARYTVRARHVVVAAQEAAKQAGNGSIDTVHLVLGLLADPDGLAAKAIIDRGVALDAVRAAAEARLPERAAQVPDKVPFTAGAKKALDLAARAGLRLGHDWIGTEHLLLGLLEQGEGPGYDVLAELGVTTEAVEPAIVRAVSDALAARNA
jgi:Clp amino terminal domain, pathogenicity island component